MLIQLHILDIKAANFIFQKAYLANALINLQSLKHIFYKINFF